VMVDFLILPFKKKCHICTKRAYFTCESCQRTACMSHTTTVRKRVLCEACENVLEN
jgi:hypothetical protein